MKLLLRALRRQAVPRPPIWLMRQAGRYLPEYREVRARAGSFLGLCYAPEQAAEVTLQPVRRFGLDAAIVFSDILVVPHALGQEVRFEAGEGPRLDPLVDGKSLHRLDLARLPGRLEPVYAALGRVAAALGPDTALIGFCGAPWTLATYMVEGAGSSQYVRVKSWAYRDPKGFDALIGLLCEAAIEHLAAQVAAGAEVVQLFDSWAGVLPEAAFRRWAIAPTRRIVDGLRRRGVRAPVIGFPRGAGLMLAEYVRDSGVDAVALDTAVSLAAAREAQRRMTVQGNLDPVMLLAGGEAMRDATAALLNGLGAGPYVFNLGHGVLPETPPEHVAALVGQVRAWRGGEAA